jgi:hypothetical protein
MYVLSPPQLHSASSVLQEAAVVGKSSRAASPRHCNFHILHLNETVVVTAADHRQVSCLVVEQRPGLGCRLLVLHYVALHTLINLDWPRIRAQVPKAARMHQHGFIMVHQNDIVCGPIRPQQLLTQLNIRYGHGA